MRSLFEVAPGINKSRIFDISDEEIDALDEDSLLRLKRLMTVKYRINVLRAKGVWRDDYLFAMNHSRSVVDSALLKYDMYRQSKTHPLLFKGRLGATIRHQLAQAEAELNGTNSHTFPSSSPFPLQRAFWGANANSETIDNPEMLGNVDEHNNHKEN